MGRYMYPSLTQDFLIEVAKGNIPGHSIYRKFGKIATIQIATPANIWEYGVNAGAEIYTFSSSNDIDTISSSSASDTVDIVIEGLDVNGDETIQTATLNGQSKVVLSTPLWRVNRMYNDDSVDLVGNVYLYEDTAIGAGTPADVTKVRSYISAGHNQTLQSVYTIPNGKTAYILGTETSLINKKTATAELTVYTREFGKVFRIQEEFDLSTVGDSTKNYNFPTPLKYPGKLDFLPKASVSINDTGISWAFSMLLVDD